MTTQYVSQKEIQEHLKKLAKARPPEDRPTEEQVAELLLRMKRRWGLA